MKAPAAGHRWHYRRSLASRVIVLTTFAVALAVAFVALGAFLTVRTSMQSTLDNSLLDRAHRATQSTALANLTADYRLPSWALGAGDIRIIFINSQREYRSFDTGPTPALGQPELDVAEGRAVHSVRTIGVGGSNYRVVAVPAGNGTALVLAQSLESQEHVLRRLGLVMLLFGLAGVIGAGLAGWAVARNGLRPVRRLTGAVEENAITEDLAPLPVDGDDEIARLTNAFNSLLTALSASRDRQRQLVADAGHELRTPLTSLRTNLDLLLMSDRSGGLPAAARQELLDDVSAQLDEFTTLIGDLVELAREDPPQHIVDSVDLAEVVDRAVARVRRRAPQVSFSVRTEPWLVTGELSALERGITNLLDNAAKWSPQLGTVSVQLVDGALTVDDQGPGIAVDDLPHVFDRFYRSQESRGMSGSGLGLSIVRQVAERHSGFVEASRAPGGGARLILRLPGDPGGRPVERAPENALNRTTR